MKKNHAIKSEIFKGDIKVPLFFVAIPDFLSISQDNRKFIFFRFAGRWAIDFQQYNVYTRLKFARRIPLQCSVTPDKTVIQHAFD